MKHVSALIGAILITFSFACQRETHVEAIVPERQPIPAVQAADEPLKRITLSAAQAKAAVKGAEMPFGSAQIGYATTDPNVVVAELRQGSGVAYVSWVALHTSDGISWRIMGKPTQVVVEDPKREIRISVKDGGKFFEVELPSSGKTIRLDLSD